MSQRSRFKVLGSYDVRATNDTAFAFPSCQVLNKDGIGKMSIILKGLDYVRGLTYTSRGQNQVLNLSFSAPRSEIMNSAANALADGGIVVVAAAGNSGESTCNFSPASADSVFAGKDIQQYSFAYQWVLRISNSFPFL